MPTNQSRKYWLMKSEPNAFSIEDLKASPDGTACWDGVRNYQARNLLRDDLKKEPALAEMGVLKKGNRLSVQPVTESEWQTILKLAGIPDPLV